MNINSRGFLIFCQTSKMFKLVVLALFVVSASSAFLVPRHTGRIVGGEDANIADYPYQLSFRSFGSHVCGASIINEKWAVTAAHCTAGGGSRYIQVVAGISNLREQGQTRNVVRLIQHPRYSSGPTDYDISLLELDTPLQLNDKVQPIALPQAGSDPAEGTPVQVTGWGSLYEGGRVADQLQKVTVAIVDRQTCRNQYGQHMITERMICAGTPAGGKDSCQGDSGGPLNGNGQLVGVVSWGRGCGRQGYSGVYANVGHLREWVRENSGL